VRVTASGYSSVERVEYVAVHGGDGRRHQVPVHWHEYQVVQNASDILLKEQNFPNIDAQSSVNASEEMMLRKVFEQRGIEYKNSILRRSIISALLPN